MWLLGSGDSGPAAHYFGKQVGVVDRQNDDGA